MTNSTEEPGARLDRIEGALDRQVALNGDLRTSVETLKNSTTELRSTAEALLQVAAIHQQNFERLTAEINADRIEWRHNFEQLTAEMNIDRQEWRSQINLIWEQLLRQFGNGRNEG